MVLMCLTICIASVEAQTIIKEKRVGKQPLPGSTRSELMGDSDILSPEAEIQGRFLLALGNDDLEEVTWLLSQGARVNQPFGKTGQTAIMLAQSRKMAQLLISRGATIGIKDADDGTVLHYAVTRSAALELIPFFVAKGADINARGGKMKRPCMLPSRTSMKALHHRQDRSSPVHHQPRHQPKTPWHNRLSN
jgi:ankyrin repeat protein